MFEDIREDILKKDLEYTYISVISQKLSVGIVGGGKAGLIKAKTFLSRGCLVYVISKDFIEEFYSLKDVKLINSIYDKSFIYDKHLIIIATDDKAINNKVKRDCEEKFKIYISSSNYKEGMAVVPTQRNLNNITFAINTKRANPKLSVILANKTNDLLKEYDSFVEYSSKVREIAKTLHEKQDIINFVCSEDFKFIYEKRKDKEVLKMFFKEEIVERLYKGETYEFNCCNKKE